MKIRLTLVHYCVFVLSTAYMYVGTFELCLCSTADAQLSWRSEPHCGGRGVQAGGGGGGFMCGRATPLTPACHCAPVMINHVLQRLALSWREGTNHTPHYPGLVTLEQSSPRTLQPVAVWGERRPRWRRRWRRRWGGEGPCRVNVCPW